MGRALIARGAALLAVRIAARPMHRRRYRTATRPGALHPPLGRALAALTEVRPGDRLLDPMCGIGTIPIEAALASSRVRIVGCDLDPEALALARGAVALAGIEVTLLRGDAATLPLDSNTVDAVAVNPPWGRAVASRGRLAAGYGPLVSELRRVVRPAGTIVVLEPSGGPLRSALRCGGFEPRRVSWVRVGGAVVDIVRAGRR